MKNAASDFEDKVQSARRSACRMYSDKRGGADNANRLDEHLACLQNFCVHINASYIILYTVSDSFKNWRSSTSTASLSTDIGPSIQQHLYHLLLTIY